jgi:hypothetical protein
MKGMLSREFTIDRVQVRRFDCENISQKRRSESRSHWIINLDISFQRRLRSSFRRILAPESRCHLLDLPIRILLDTFRYDSITQREQRASLQDLIFPKSGSWDRGEF